MQITKIRNIGSFYKFGLCTGCGTCASACPAKCIRMIKDDYNGIYFPQIDHSKCLYCGACLEVCPGYFIDFKMLNIYTFGKLPEDDLLGNYIAGYIGYAADCEIRYNSSSGGLITALLCFMLEEGIIDGAVVTMMNEKKPLEPKVIIATDKNQIISASGSKYCPVPLNTALNKIINSTGKFAVVGLPCHIHGIRKFESKNKELKEKIVMHFGLFCANTVKFLGTEFFLEKWNIQKRNIKEIKYRSEGWPGKITIVLKNGTKKKIIRGPAMKTRLYRILYSSAFHFDFMPIRCLVCPDQTNELADISFGDAWLSELLKTEKAGISIVISRTKEGENLLRKACRKGIIKLIKIDRSTIIRSQNFHYKSKFGSRIRILKLFRRPVPHFIGKKLPQKTSIVDYMDFLLYLPSFISSKRSLWRFLMIVAIARSLLLIPLSFLRIKERRK